MFRKNKSARSSYGIVGLGRFGHALATELAQSGADIIVLDRDEEKIREMRELTENAYVVKSLDKKTLLETGIQNCDMAIVCLSSQLDTSILTTLNLVTLGVPQVLAKATSQEHGEILEKLGAEVVYPERDMAVRLAHRLETAQVLDYIQLSEQLNISKLLVAPSMAGRTVLQLDLRRRFGVNIIALERGPALEQAITPDLVFETGDILYLCGSRGGLQRLAEEYK